jgi:hypothetical protein
VIITLSWCVHCWPYCMAYYTLVQHFYVTNIMEQRSYWEADSCLAGQQIIRLLWNPKLYYRVCRSTPLGSIVGQINPFRVLTPYLFKIHFNIIFPFTPVSACSLFFRFSDQGERLWTGFIWFSIISSKRCKRTLQAWNRCFVGKIQRPCFSPVSPASLLDGSSKRIKIE